VEKIKCLAQKYNNNIKYVYFDEWGRRLGIGLGVTYLVEVIKKDRQALTILIFRHLG